MASIKPNRRWAVWWLFAALFGAILFQQMWTASRQTEAISYTEFEKLVSEKKVAEVTVGQDTIQGTLNEPTPEGKTRFVTARVDPALAINLRLRALRCPERRPLDSSAPFFP